MQINFAPDRQRTGGRGGEGELKEEESLLALEHYRLYKSRMSMIDILRFSTSPQSFCTCKIKLQKFTRHLIARNDMLWFFSHEPNRIVCEGMHFVVFLF